MPAILDFQIQPLSAESYSLTVCERGSSQPLASGAFSHRVDFLTDFSVDRLNASTKDAADRFDELQKLGRELYQKLFPPSVEQVWNEYKQRSEFLILCLRFAGGATKLEVLPLETLHDGAEFIAAGTNTTLTRLPLDVAPPGELPLIPRPLKLFGFFASPLDLQDHERLNAEREQEILLEAINDPAGQERISVEIEDEAKLEILERSLRDGYHILHFTGHGISPREGGGLLLEDAHGKMLPASIAKVMQAVESGVDKLRLAVISGCQTARTLHTGAFNDLARELLRQRVPAVIAMQFSISDDGGLKFAEVLYREIAKGVELERAVHTARRVLLEDKQFFINNDALAIVLLAADGACLQTTEAVSLPLQAEPDATYLGDRLDPLAHGFYGRRREYRKIRDALLHQDQRAVIIHGIGGIGKTALLTHAINRLRPRFKDVMSFDCRRAALAPETILLELHRYFATRGKPQLQSLIGQNAPPETLAEEIAQVLMQLTEWPLLIVFDNFESQLDERRAFLNEDLRVFLATLLRETATSSRFLFTTRYLFDLGGERFGDLLQLPLGDLSRPEALMLMQKLPNLTRVALRHKKAALEKFGGHPYALVALDRHCGHQSLNQALQDAASLESELREYLAIELNYRRLSDQARDLLNWLAVFRQPVPTEAAEWVMGEKISYAAEILRKHGRDVIAPEYRELDESAIVELLDKSLPERRSADQLDRPIAELIEYGLLILIQSDERLTYLTVHSLVRDFCRERQEGETWHNRLRDAAGFYSNLTKSIGRGQETPSVVWSRMEAFELLIEAHDFEAAATILLDADPHLDRWGFGRYVESQYRRLLGRVEDRTTAAIIHNYAMLLQERGEYDSAIDQFNQSAKILKELRDRAGEAKSLHQVGMIHQVRGEHGLALKYFEQSLRIEEELDNRLGIAATLHQIGMVHQDRGEYELAIERYEQSLKIEKELDDREGVAGSLLSIGAIHQLRGEYEMALKKYEQSLKIFEELGHRVGIANILYSVGMIHQDQGEYEPALNCYEGSLKITEDLGDREGVAKSLRHIGMIYRLRSEYPQAIDCFEQSLKIEEELGNRLGVAGSLHQIGIIYQAYGEEGMALERYEQSLKLYEELGDRIGVGYLSGQIGMIFEERGEYDAALERYLQFHRLMKELGDLLGLAKSLLSLGAIYQLRGENKMALEHFEQSLEIFEELDNREGVANTLLGIGTVHQSCDENEAAKGYYEQSLMIFEELGDRLGVALSRDHIGRLLAQVGYYAQAFEHLLFALDSYSELQSPNAEAMVNALNDLRNIWGEREFDAAWQEATNEELPEWLTDKSEATAS